MQYQLNNKGLETKDSHTLANDLRVLSKELCLLTLVVKYWREKTHQGAMVNARPALHHPTCTRLTQDLSLFSKTSTPSSNLKVCWTNQSLTSSHSKTALEWKISVLKRLKTAQLQTINYTDYFANNCFIKLYLEIQNAFCYSWSVIFTLISKSLAILFFFLINSSSVLIELSSWLANTISSAIFLFWSSRVSTRFRVLVSSLNSTVWVSWFIWAKRYLSLIRLATYYSIAT